MAPRQPPPPVPWSRPDQSSVGSQTSTRIFESADGAIVSATRQNGGRLVIGAPVGGVNVPPVMDCVAVIVALGMRADCRLSQVTAGQAAGAHKIRRANVA